MDLSVTAHNLCVLDSLSHNLCVSAWLPLLWDMTPFVVRQDSCFIIYDIIWVSQQTWLHLLWDKALVSQQTESCFTAKGVMSHVHVSQSLSSRQYSENITMVIQISPCVYTWMSHVSQQWLKYQNITGDNFRVLARREWLKKMNESCLATMIHMKISLCVYTWMSHVSQQKESCLTVEDVMSITYECRSRLGWRWYVNELCLTATHCIAL